MRTRELEFLDHLVRLGSVSDAARAVNTTQPNASKMLKKIEGHFGFALFERVNGRLRLTEEGRQIADQAEITLISLERLEARARDLREMRHGRLAVGATPQLSREWAPRLLADFMTAHPKIVTSIHTRNSRKLVELVSERQLDFALGLLTSDDPHVDFRRLFDIELLAALHRDNPLCRKARLRPRDFHRQEFIDSSMLDRSREMIGAFFQADGAEPVIRGEGSLSCSRLHLVERGVGITMVDSMAAGEYAGGVVEFRPMSPPLHLRVWSMKSKLRPRSQLVDRFEEMAMERAKGMRAAA